MCQRSLTCLQIASDIQNHLVLHSPKHYGQIQTWSHMMIMLSPFFQSEIHPPAHYTPQMSLHMN